MKQLFFFSFFASTSIFQSQVLLAAENPELTKYFDQKITELTVQQKSIVTTGNLFTVSQTSEDPVFEFSDRNPRDPRSRSIEISPTIEVVYVKEETAK